MMKKDVIILGVTGSIGTQALDVIRAFPDQFQLKGMSGQTNIDAMIKIAKAFQPPYIAVSCDAHRSLLLESVQYQPHVFVGASGLVRLATVDMDILLVAIVGTAALPPVVAAIPKVSHIAIANKEVLVAAGSVIMDMVHRYNTRLIPVDSEHSALFQCLAAVDFKMDVVKTLTLTASGGPFFKRDPNTFHLITREDALKHPNWDMGAKITIDSATMMNKGLEVIEAHHLFNVSFDDIDVVIHPQSIVHSFIETIDGAIFSHMGRPDMRYPIQYAMTYPDRLKTPFKQDHLTTLSGLEFLEPNMAVFPLLKMAIECGRIGGAMPIIFNAANEVAVSLFLNQKIKFIQIAQYIEDQLSMFGDETVQSIDDIIALDTRVKSESKV